MMKAQHLIVDSGGFLKNADIRSLGENIYSIKEVVTEIRDKATRQRLSFLPYEINFKDPTPASVQKVIEVAKKTGDYASLSSVDIKVLALTYELTNQFDPECIQDVDSTKSKFQFGSLNGAAEGLPGFYMPKFDDNQDAEHASLEQSGNDLGCQESSNESQDVVENIVDLQIRDENDKDIKLEDPGNQELSDDDEDPADSGNEEELNGGGWITPSNIQKVREPEENQDVQVACITTDYAMQNVLMKLGLNVVSVDGIRIKTIRTYVLRCHACFNVTKIMTKSFCPKCGNNTLKRVPMEVQPDGTVKYFLSKNPRVLNKRGKKTSLPMPKGGKHAFNPILCEDQPVPQNRVSRKALQKTNVWSDDYAINGNPFALNETESKAFKLGIRRGNRSGGRHGNPNAVNKKFVKRR